MHEAALSRAVVPDRYRILRLKLMPYSLGHELLLHRQGNAFITMTEEAFDALPLADQLRAVMQVVLICCTRLPWPMWLWSRRASRTNIVQLCEIAGQLREYVTAGVRAFPADLPASEDSTVRYIGAPEILRLYRFIIATVPRQEVELWGKSAWDFPYSLAKMLWQSAAEDAGNLEIENFKTQTHNNFIQECEAARAAWAKCTTKEEKIACVTFHPRITEMETEAEAIAAELEQLKTERAEATCPA